MTTQVYREAWLTAVAERLEPVFLEAGFPVPSNIRVTCGFPSRGGRGKRIGECWASTASKDEHFEIMVSPVLEEPMFVAGVLAHELCHAAAGLKCGHRGTFKKLATSIGLVGKMSATIPGDIFIKHAQPILTDVGPYPHAMLNPTASSGPPKQTTRNLKLTCPKCGYRASTTRYWLDTAGAPICPADETQMVEG